MVIVFIAKAELGLLERDMNHKDMSPFYRRREDEALGLASSSQTCKLFMSHVH